MIRQIAALRKLLWQKRHSPVVTYLMLAPQPVVAKGLALVTNPMLGVVPPACVQQDMFVV